MKKSRLSDEQINSMADPAHDLSSFWYQVKTTLNSLDAAIGSVFYRLVYPTNCF